MPVDLKIMTRIKTKSEGRGDDTDSCGDHASWNAKLPLMDDFNFDSQETAVVGLIRHISCGLATAEFDGIRHAQARAELEWQSPYNERILQSVICLMNIIRVSRTTLFDFIVADCPACCRFICQSELQIMMMLREGRAGDMDKLAIAAQLVVGAGEPDDLIVIAKSFADMLNDISRTRHRGNSLLH